MAISGLANEVPSRYLGELVMEELRHVDQVAYVRFASVYREFEDVTEFMRELEVMLDRRRGVKEGAKDAAPAKRRKKSKAKGVGRKAAAPAPDEDA